MWPVAENVTPGIPRGGAAEAQGGLLAANPRHRGLALQDVRNSYSKFSEAPIFFEPPDG